MNATDVRRRSVSKRHIFFLSFRQLSRQKAYTGFLGFQSVARTAGTTKGTTKNRSNVLNARFVGTLKRTGDRVSPLFKYFPGNVQRDALGRGLLQLRGEGLEI